MLSARSKRVINCSQSSLKPFINNDLLVAISDLGNTAIIIFNEYDNKRNIFLKTINYYFNLL